MTERRIRGTAAPLCAAALLMGIAGPLAAEEGGDANEALPATTLDESIVVTANRLETKTEEVGSSVSVITAEEIALSGATTVAELLRSLPGLEVARGGGPGQVTSVFIRGGSSSHTLVLLDGVRLNAPGTGAYDFANLTTDSIERIEVVRGPQSTLYGSEAVAGVISITSKRGSASPRGGVNVSALAEAGELAHQRWQLALDGGGDRFDFALAVADESIDGVSAASERAGNREDDPYDITSASARLGFGFGDDGRVSLSVRTFDGEVANDGFDFFTGSAVDDPNRRQQREGVVASLRLQTALGERFNQTFLLGLSDEELSGSDPDNFFSNFTVADRSFEVSSQSDVALTPSDTLTLGFSYEERDTTSAGNFDESIDILSLFAHNAWALGDRFHATVGVRHDDHSQFGDETTYRASATGRLGRATRLHGSFGTGFKAPTLNDLFFPFFSNLDLLPETSEGFDVGVEQSFFEDRLTVDVTWFDTDFDNLIAFDFVTFTPQNIARASASGLEVTLDYRPGPDVHITASHTTTDTEDTAGLQLARRPRNRSTLNLYLHPLPRLRAAAALIAVADRVDTDGSEMDDYERVDLTLRYRASELLEPYLRLENLFDEEYEEVNGFTSPGAVAVVGLRFSY